MIEGWQWKHRVRRVRGILPESRVGNPRFQFGAAGLILSDLQENILLYFTSWFLDQIHSMGLLESQETGRNQEMSLCFFIRFIRVLRKCIASLCRVLLEYRSEKALARNRTASLGRSCATHPKESKSYCPA